MNNDYPQYYVPTALFPLNFYKTSILYWKVDEKGKTFVFSKNTPGPLSVSNWRQEDRDRCVKDGLLEKVTIEELVLIL